MNMALQACQPLPSVANFPDIRGVQSCRALSLKRALRSASMPRKETDVEGKARGEEDEGKDHPSQTLHTAVH